MASGDVDVGRNRLLRLLAAVARKAAKQGVARAGGFGAIQIFTGQRTERQARVGQQLDAFILADFR